MTSRLGKSITWYSYNQPNRINYRTSDYAEFSYGPDRSRFKQLAVTGGTTATTYRKLPEGQQTIGLLPGMN